MTKLSDMLCYDYSWSYIGDGIAQALFNDFADHGAKRLDIVSSWCVRMDAEPEFADRLRAWAAAAGLGFVSAHAPWGPDDDLNQPDAGKRALLLEKHKKLLGMTSALGAKVYVCHIGSPRENCPPDKLRGLTCESLEALLPAAEKTVFPSQSKTARRRPIRTRNCLDISDVFRRPRCRSASIRDMRMSLKTGCAPPRLRRNAMSAKNSLLIFRSAICTTTTVFPIFTRCPVRGRSTGILCLKNFRERRVSRLLIRKCFPAVTERRSPRSAGLFQNFLKGVRGFGRELAEARVFSHFEKEGVEKSLAAHTVIRFSE